MRISYWRLCQTQYLTSQIKYFAFAAKVIFIAFILNQNIVVLAETPLIKTFIPVNLVAACRLNNYLVQFDVMRGQAKIGKATRELTHTKHPKRLLSNFSASMAFLQFSQKEQSILPQYNEFGFYSSEYLKQTKKPFKSRQEERQFVNETMSKDSNLLLDPLSVYEHLREQVCSGLRENVSFNVLNKNEIFTYYFEYRGLENLKLAQRTTKAFRFVRTRKTNARETSIWFAADYHFLPIKIEQQKDGDTQALLLATSAIANAQ